MVRVSDNVMKLLNLTQILASLSPFNKSISFVMKIKLTMLLQKERNSMIAVIAQKDLFTLGLVTSFNFTIGMVIPIGHNHLMVYNISI